MTSGTRSGLSEVVVFARGERDRADDLLGAVVPARLRGEPVSAAAPVLDNVVPFVRPRGNDNARAEGPVLQAQARLAPASAVPHGWARRAALVAVSLLVHGALFAALWREPPELAGTELEAISVEIVPGSNALAGRETTPSETEGDINRNAPVEAPTEPVEQAAERTTDQAPEIPVAERETAPESPVVAEQPAPEPPPPEPVVAEAPKPAEPEPPREVAQEEPRDTVAMVESPQAEIATQAPVETPPDAANPTLLPQAEAKPEPTPDETPVAPVPLPEPRPEAAKPVAPPKPPEPAKPKPEQARKPAPKPKDTVRRRIAARSDARTSERSAGAVSTRASTGAGLGRASRNANYAGQVSAHLQRHKQYPPEARARGDEGRATVSFSLDGGGRVTSVRLARSSGVASLDREVQAMVRRASPFPAPPDGRAQSFSVPVGFGLR